MPQSRLKPSDIAAEAKRTYIPYIERCMPDCPARSLLVQDSEAIIVDSSVRSNERLRVAVIDGDPVDVALDWYLYNVEHSHSSQDVKQIPVVNMAHEKNPGGDWEATQIAPEECFARRSNLVQALVTPWYPPAVHYPIPNRGGLYSPSVVVFRDGPEMYEVWREFKSLPVISVPPIRRPKLTESGTKYSFEEEKVQMMDKIRTVLRIAAHYGHRDICLGAYGIGSLFKNPVKEVAMMWKTLLFHDEEFDGAFSNVVFAIENPTSDNGRPRGPSPFDVFTNTFSPGAIFHTQFN